MTATSFVVSIVLANRVYARFGVAGAACCCRSCTWRASACWLVLLVRDRGASSGSPSRSPSAASRTAAWTAFYNVVPTERRAQVLAFIDGVPGPDRDDPVRLLLLLAAGHVPGADQVFWLGA